MPSKKQKLQRILQIWKPFLILVLSFSLLGIGSCTAPIPVWNGKIWAGDSNTSSIQRAQSGEAIACNESNFDNYLCISYTDFQSFYETYVLGCKKWDDSLAKMSPQEAFALLKTIQPKGK